MGEAVETTVLYRPTGERELALIQESGWRAFPPRLPEQPIFYPVLEEAYAVQIAREWNTRDGEKGYVLRFYVNSEYLSGFPTRSQAHGCIANTGFRPKSLRSLIAILLDRLGYCTNSVARRRSMFPAS